MSLGPKGADLLRKTFKRNAAEAQAGSPSATQFLNMAESEQVSSFFRVAMKKYELEQAHMNAGKSFSRHPEPEIDMLDIDIESVDRVLMDRMTMVMIIGSKEARDYHRWRRQERQRVADSLTKEFECLL